jgi:hypothetical protein
MNLNSFRYCPEITKKELCSGKGEGFIPLLKHFITKDITGRPPQGYPILKEPRVWRLWGITEDSSDTPRSAAVQDLHQTVLMGRHYFLIGVVYRIVDNLVSR